MTLKTDRTPEEWRKLSNWIHDTFGVVGPTASYRFHEDLNDCHAASMWLRENHPEAYSVYATEIWNWARLMKDREGIAQWVNAIAQDAPAPVRAAALEQAFEIIGG